MHKRSQQLIVGFTAVAAFALIPAAAARQTATSSSSTEFAQQEDSLAAAARKAKAQQSHAKPAKVFTNDNMPTTGVVSTVGVAPTADSAATAAAAAPAAQSEQHWREKFATLNKKLAQDQAELTVMQRELGQLNLQNYSDPNQAVQQGYSRSDIDKKTADINAKQKEIEADKQAISDAESDLRKSGGDAGWAR